MAPEGKGNAVWLSAWAGSLRTSGLAMGCPTQPGQSCPVLETCYAVCFNFLFVQMYVLTIVSGRGECLTLMFKTELYFCL